FLVGVSDERIQKVIIPQEGEPYPLASTSVSFEVPHGSVSVTKKDADSGKMLAGAVFVRSSCKCRLFFEFSFSNTLPNFYIMPALRASAAFQNRRKSCFAKDANARARRVV
ncbi:MAG: hypothetical protein IKA40_05515, partial [Clostridia bacterium]|nr:hypothetical protein [Clostridia bacterium]